MRKLLLTVGASVALVVPLTGTAVAAPDVVLAEAPCQNVFNGALAAIGGGALTGGIAGPAGALAGGIAGLIGGGTAVASCLDDQPAKNRSGAA